MWGSFKGLVIGPIFVFFASVSGLCGRGWLKYPSQFWCTRPGLRLPFACRKFRGVI
jgi:hypothetical protein